MIQTNLSTDKYKNLSFSPERIEELEMMSKSKTIIYSDRNLVYDCLVDQTIYYNNSNDKITLSLGLYAGDKYNYGEIDIEPQTFVKILFESYEKDIDINDLSSFKHYYNLCYNNVVSSAVQNMLLFDNTYIHCFGFIIKDDKVISTIDNAMFNIEQINNNYNKKLNLLALVGYYTLKPDEMYNIELYAVNNNDLKITFNDVQYSKCIRNGIIKQCEVLVNGSINYDNVKYDNLPDLYLDIDNIKNTNQKNVLNFIKEREQYLDFSKENILNSMHKKLFNI